ncbi:MAG: RHS repeat-associated core domain-containing protein [Armatimonadota bacterium]
MIRATRRHRHCGHDTFTTEALGNTVSQWGNRSNPYRFAGLWGYRDDGDAGLSHVGACYYDPQVGRFISRDAPPYLYCEHEPVNAVDPSRYRIAGLERLLSGAGLVAGGIGLVGGSLLFLL